MTMGGGMGPSIMLPMPIPRADIRTEAKRLGYRGEGLEDLCEIVEQLDHAFIEMTARRESERARAERVRSQRR